MKKTVYFLGLIVILVSFSSCATLLGGSKKGVKVKGTPPNAQVYYNGAYIGDAPVNVKVPKSAKQGNSKVTVKADNYEPTDIELTRKWSLGYTVLDIITGFVPLIVDAATGNIYQPKPGTVKYKLLPKSSFAVGNEVIITKKRYANIVGEITAVTGDLATVKFTRPATAVEKQTQKVDEITEAKDFYFNEIKLK